MSMFLESLSDQARYAELIQLLRPDYPFVQLGFHLGAKAEPTSRTLRVMREGRHLIKKEYLGQLNGKTENEIGLLMAAACKGLQHTASFKTVHAMTCNVNESAAPSMELLMKNYGLDLEDWLFLFKKARLDVVASPYFFLAIWHYVLSAMKEFHQAKFVQVDVKPDNICVALPNFADSAFAESSQTIALTFDLRELTIIDLGEALHPDANKRVLLFHHNGMALGPGNDYISRHYKKQKSLVSANDMKPLRCLDWRIDFYPLGRMAEDWNNSTPFPAKPPAQLSPEEKQTYAEAINLLHQLPQWLKSEDTDPSTEVSALPHDALLQKIDRLVNLDKWSAIELCLPVRIDKDPASVSIALGKSLLRQIGKNSHTSAMQMKRPIAAQETQLDKPAMTLSPNHALQNNPHSEQGEALRQFNRRQTQRRGQHIVHIDIEALTWYRKTLEQGRTPPSDVDLLC